VIEAVPAQLDGELTQPVDEAGGNPFASDEPTETAFIEPMPALVNVTTTPRLPAELKSTQPMRVLEDEDEATADTIPPADKPKAKPAASAKPDAPKAADLGSDETIDIKADDAALDAKPDAAVTPPADAAAAKPVEAAPAEIETADTGQIRIPKDQDAG
jgi:hypothetical protein